MTISWKVTCPYVGAAINFVTAKTAEEAIEIGYELASNGIGGERAQLIYKKPHNYLLKIQCEKVIPAHKQRETK